MGQLDQILARHEVVGVDTSPFIYLWERHPRYFNLAEELFQHLKQPQVQGVTSIITLIEVSIHPRKQGRPDLVEAYENALLHSQQVQLLSIDIALARQAVALRATCQYHSCGLA